MSLNLTLPTREIPVFELVELRERTRQLISQGGRILGFFGSPGSSLAHINLNLVFVDSEGKLGLLRSECGKSGAFHSLSREFPLFHCFEREIHEQHGIRVTDAPWLKPLRFSGGHQGEMASYPFYVLEGKELHEVGVGPVHAGIIEPGHFRFVCYGETVHHLEIQLGYQYRGLEELLKRKAIQALAPWIETVAGDTTIAHTWAYCQAWESLCGFRSSLEMDLSRGLALELERIAMHLAGLAGMATDIAFLPGGSTYGRLRTAIINSSMRLCGSRFGRGWLRPGEVRFDSAPSLLIEIRKTLEEFAGDLAGINDHFLSSHTVRHRLRTTGALVAADAHKMGFVGMAARSTGVTIDLRAKPRDGTYAQLPIAVVQELSGDCWARARIRIREIDESLKWIFRALDLLQNAKGATWKHRLGSAAPNSVAISAIEGWRGEVLHFMETDEEGKLRHYKLQDPSLRNWFALALAVRGNAISDFPICNKSFDLSYCGHDL